MEEISEELPIKYLFFDHSIRFSEYSFLFARLKYWLCKMSILEAEIKKVCDLLHKAENLKKLINCEEGIKAFHLACTKA